MGNVDERFSPEEPEQNVIRVPALKGRAVAPRFIKATPDPFKAKLHRDKPGRSLDTPLPVALRDLQKDRNI